jgi:hypothetical protein
VHGPGAVVAEWGEICGSWRAGLANDEAREARARAGQAASAVGGEANAHEEVVQRLGEFVRQ